jgi:curved DNA-binding protein
MQYKDYYQTLGVARGADADEIKRAYRKLARKYHPDVSKEKNAEEKFKEVSEAYEVLHDTDKRAAYDQLGRDYRTGQQFRPPPDWAQRYGAGRGAGQFSDSGGFSDFFSSLFGGGTAGGFGGAGPAPEADAGFLDITIEEAFAGIRRNVMLNEGGNRRQIGVQIPAGIADGQSLRVAGVGGRPALLFKVRIREHHLYELKGKDVYVDLPLAPWEAALGAKIEVPTLAGTVGLTIPVGTQSGQKLRLRGRGFPGTPAGDQFVLIKVVVPPAQSDEAKAFYQKMRQELPFDPREDWP